MVIPATIRGAPVARCAGLTVWKVQPTFKRWNCCVCWARATEGGSSISAAAGFAGKLPDGLASCATAWKREYERRRGRAITLRDQQSAQTPRSQAAASPGQSLAFALLCEAAGQGDPRQAQSAWRYLETIEPPGFGAEDEIARRGVAGVAGRRRSIGRPRILGGPPPAETFVRGGGGNFVPAYPACREPRGY